MYTTPRIQEAPPQARLSTIPTQFCSSFLHNQLLIRKYYNTLTTAKMLIPETQIAAVLPPTGASPTAQLQISTTRPVPSPREGEILVKFEYSGVCHSDVHSVRGETPMLTDVAGHEGVGKVVQGRYLYPDVFEMTMLINFCSTVGSGLGETKWMGERVGIR